MLLSDVVKVIEFTDTDHYSHAMEVFNTYGMTHSDNLPFLNVVYDKAGEVLLEKFEKVGFKGDLQLVKTTKGDYIIFDADRFTEKDVLIKFE